MSRLDELPPDLRATLSLLVDRGKSYAQVAELLGIPESVVRDRAHAALDTLAGAPRFAAVGGGAGSGPLALANARPASAGPAPDRAGGDRELPGAERPAARAAGSSRAPSTLPVSRRGGAALLAAIVAIVVVVVVLITSGGGSGHAGTGASAGSAQTAGSGTSTASGKTPKITKQITLSPAEPSSKAIGIVEVLAEANQHAFFIAAEHLEPSHGFFYAVWLYNSPSKAEAISKSPAVGSNGRLQGGSLLPSNAGEFHQILLTRETSERPVHPGPTVLSGPFSLG
jgi:hypothetical protein